MWKIKKNYNNFNYILVFFLRKLSYCSKFNFDPFSRQAYYFVTMPCWSLSHCRPIGRDLSCKMRPTKAILSQERFASGKRVSVFMESEFVTFFCDSNAHARINIQNQIRMQQNRLCLIHNNWVAVSPLQKYLELKMS